MAEENKDARKLFVFDFDNTLVNGNADTWIGDTLGNRDAMEAVKAEMNDTWYDDWRTFVNKLLYRLHQDGASRDDILAHMRKLKLHEEAMKSLKSIRETPDADAIIISDANTVFIECIIQECGVEDVFDTVLSNPGSFDEKGLMTVKWYHTHNCKICDAVPNMCKGKILSDYLKNCEHSYSKVVYIGDGRNDLCPVLQLRPCDTAIARKSFGLDKALAQGFYELKPKLHIVDFIKELSGVIISECY